MAKGEIAKTIVNYLGFETIGKTGKRRKHPFVIRGNGLLTITDKYVSFHRLFPKKDYMIPLLTIFDVSIKNIHNLTLSLDPVLKISFEEEKGRKIVLGLLVNTNKDAEDLKEKILSNIKGLEDENQVKIIK